MIKLDLLQTFAMVVNLGSFSAAARRMGVPRSTVSLHIQTLESALQLRLFKRSTRALVLTQDGEQLHALTQTPLDQLNRALQAMQGQAETMRGTIRMTVPADFPTEPLAGAIAAFSRLHPEVRFQIRHTSERLDLVRENIDIALRISDGSPPDAVERPVLDIGWMFCASCDWLDQHGMPGSLSARLDFISPPADLRAYLERHVLAGQRLPEAAIEVDHLAMARSLAVEGFGVALLPAGMVQAEVAEGRLQVILPDVALRGTRLNLAFPTRADMLPRVRAFADHLIDALRPEAGAGPPLPPA
jgi:DNA-binding transcriptional LysR family regulator